MAGHFCSFGDVCGLISGPFVVLNTMKKGFTIGDSVSLVLLPLRNTILVVMSKFLQFDAKMDNDYRR